RPHRAQKPGRRDPAGDPGELLFRPGLPPRVCERNRPAHRGQEVAGRVSDLCHGRLSLPVGGHRTERGRGGGGVNAWEGGAAMGKLMIRRTFYAIVTLFILSLTIFTVVRLTGDPVTLLAEPGARAEDLDRVRAEWGLDRPWPVQYLAFAKNVVTGQLGK